MFEIEKFMNKIIYEFIQSVNSEHIRIYTTYNIYQKLSASNLIILNDLKYGRYEAQYKGHRIDIDIDIAMPYGIKLQYKNRSDLFRFDI